MVTDVLHTAARPPTRVHKTVTLRDGRSVTVRTLTKDDVDRSLAFFCALPPADRRYLRVDVTRRELVERRIDDMSADRVERLAAIAGDDFVADGSLEITGHGWGHHIGEIRLIVAHAFQRLGLGTLLARELYFLAMQHQLDRVVARVMRPQIGAHRIMQRLGFHEEFLIPDHVRDQEGNWQDLIIMRCNLDQMWHEMESLLEQSDWQWHR